MKPTRLIITIYGHAHYINLSDRRGGYHMFIKLSQKHKVGRTFVIVSLNSFEFSDTVYVAKLQNQLEMYFGFPVYFYNIESKHCLGESVEVIYWIQNNVDTLSCWEHWAITISEEAAVV